MLLYSDKQIIKEDYQISTFVAFYFFASAANATMKVTLPISEGMSGVVSLFWGMLILLFMFRALKPVLRRSSAILRKSYGIFAVLYCISIAMWASRGEPIGQLFRATGFLTFAWWIPVGVYSCSVIHKDILYKVLLKVSYIISVILFINLLFHRTDTAVEGVIEYDMFFGFAMITPTLFHINELLKKRKLSIVVITIAEVLSLILYANRSILLSLLFFIFYKIFVVGNTKRMRLYKPLFVLLCIVMVIFSGAIISGLSGFFSQYGMQSRTLDMAMDNSLSDSSGRLEFWAFCIDMIGEKPIFGWGLGGEFVTLGKRLYSIFGGEDIGMASAHNGVLQFLVELGIVGGIIATYLFVKPIFGVKKRITDSNVRDLIVIYFASYGITRLVSADGFYYSPQVAVYFYLYYTYKKNSIQQYRVESISDNATTIMTQSNQ